VTTTGVPGEPDPQEAAETELPMRYRRFDCTADDPSLNTEATEAAREAIEAGECIVLPTDTVYGIGVDAFSAKAVQRLLDAKHRGRDMPPPVLIGEPTLIRALAVDVPETAKDLVGRHWPGALTVICRIQPSLRMDLGDTEGTIALRVPDHELAREILRRTGPMAVSSANISGRSAALTCDEAVEQLGDTVAVYLDGGPLRDAAGAPSTIVDFTHEEDGQVLRRGAISLETLRETVPNLLDLADDGNVAEDGSPADPGHISAAGA
jgi:L-threonylcarbamoyladenylate synthase